MDADPGIICFNHCGFRVFSKETLPELCPVCHTHIGNHLSLFPFRLPYPFVRAIQYPCSVVIKPTRGNFLNDYDLSRDLHIGVTTSDGKVLEFDGDGLHDNRTISWDQCLVVYREIGVEWLEKWDKTLNQIASHDCWTAEQYNEETFNCYTFVLAFLRCMSMGEISEHAKSKMKFCEFYVLPVTNNAFKYIKLFRHVEDGGYFVSKSLNM